MSKIVSISTQLPKNQHTQEQVMGFADRMYCKSEEESRKLRFLFRQSGIQTRYSVIPDFNLPLEERQFFSKTENLEPFPDLETRMRWFHQYAGPLSVKAIEDCLAGVASVNDITHLITVSCTGMSAPGLDLEIMEAMQMPLHLNRTSVNFMGCYAAVHALKMANAICISEPNAQVVIVCTELCTLHIQKESTPDNITSTLLFGDGCAAVLVQGENHTLKGIRLENFYSEVVFKGKQDMAWEMSSSGFLMTLSGYIPSLVKADFGGLVERALKKQGLVQSDIKHWCMHAGGKKILEAIERSLSLSHKDLVRSYDILKDFGNLSSANILFVLKSIFETLKAHPPAEHQKIFGASFGPGLTMETFTASYG